MARKRVLPVIIATALVGGAGIACSSSSAPSKPPLCSSLDALKASVHKLSDVDISANGLSELRTDLQTVSADADAVVRDAKNQYAPDAARIKDDVSALKSAAAAAQANPSAASLSAVGGAVKTISSDVKTLADSAASAC
jgi:hypothetical protein